MTNLGAELVIQAAKEKGIKIPEKDAWPNPVKMWKKDAAGNLYEGTVESIEDARLVIIRLIEYQKLNKPF